MPRLVLLALFVVPGCASDEAAMVEVADRDTSFKSAATVRSERRAYDGAPPVIPHAPMGAACNSCHGAEGIAVPDLGFSPPSPHAQTSGLSSVSNCRQCHVFRRASTVWTRNAFAGLSQDLRTGRRLNNWAPPVIPHKVFMRENCQACHTGPAAREEIRTTHPERARCTQCHVERVTLAEFSR